ncbi:MAG TPA: hypothetical protein VD978_09575 [Azospirillum sp.]|nr:hypothetical protein [Azospirillum sp.]
MTVQSIATGAAWPTPSAAKAGSPNGGAFAKVLEDTASTPAQSAASRPVVNGRKLATPPLWDVAHDPATKSFSVEKFTQTLKADTAKFAEELQERLSAAGIDTSVPVTFDVGADGSVLVRGEHPQKEAIERLFADDPEFANRYRMIASGNALAATFHVASRYVIDWNEADDDKERHSVWERHVAFNQNLERVSGQLTLSGGSLTSPATQMAANFLGVPASLLG